MPFMVTHSDTAGRFISQRENGYPDISKLPAGPTAQLQPEVALPHTSNNLFLLTPPSHTDIAETPRTPD
jgi:hypothetical protein